MSDEAISSTESCRSNAIMEWEVLLRDEDALLAAPGAHHKVLLRQAHALHESHLIDRDDLGDLLEQADGALAYAVEALFDIPSVEA